MMRWTDGVGRTIIIAGIAGALFAGFLALTPRLTASNSSSVTPTTAVTSTAATSALPSISDPVEAVPSTGDDFDVTVTTDATTTTAPTTTVTTAGDSTTTTSTMVDGRHDGTISLAVEARGPRDAKEEGILVEGDEIQWRFLVTNESDRELWGTYVYLELHGPAWCDEHNLEPGESTDCWLVTTAVEGSHTAEAWATAWTLERQVAAEVRYSFTVSR